MMRNFTVTHEGYFHAVAITEFGYFVIDACSVDEPVSFRDYGNGPEPENDSWDGPYPSREAAVRAADLAEAISAWYAYVKAKDRRDADEARGTLNRAGRAAFARAQADLEDAMRDAGISDLDELVALTEE